MPRLEPDDSLHAELDAHPAETDRYYIQVDGGEQTEPVFGWYLVSHLNVLGPILAALRSLFIPASAGGPASLDLHEDTDNGSSRVRITAPAALGVDRTLTAPDADGTLARTADITFETLDAAGDVGTGVAQVAVGNHAHPASAITSGTLAHERGGLEADVSAYNGVPRISAGVTSALALGIANDALLQAKNTPASGELARFTATGIEGLTEAEFKAAANLEVGVDVAAAGAYAPGGTDVAVADGGTGVSTLPSGQLITGAGTSPVTGTPIPAGGLAGITALGLKADSANPVFTGTVTIPDGALAIADTSGLQPALDAKAPLASPTFTGIVTLPATVVVPDAALAIADTSGLQGALDGKQPLDADLTTLSTAFVSAAATVPASLKLAEATNNGTMGLILSPPAVVATSDKAVVFQDIAGTVYVSGGTDVPVADGGTGVSTLASGQLVTGAGTSPVTGTAIPAGGLAGLTALNSLAGPNAPILVTGDLALVAATHHGKTLEISAATSPRITCAQIGAGVRVSIHRPIQQPSPILLPPSTTGVWLGGADMGFNRIPADGAVEVEYSNGNIPKVRGDLQWGGRPTTTDWASIADLTDLRRGEGLSTAVVGDPISAWSSQGAASDSYTQATPGAQPSLTSDGGVKIAPAATPKWLGNTVRTFFSGNVLAVSFALRLNSYTSAEARLLLLEEASDNRVRLTIPNATQVRLQIAAPAQTAMTDNIAFPATQLYRALVVVLDRANGKTTWLTNSRSSTTDTSSILTRTAAQYPNWTAWTLISGQNAIGDVTGFSTCDYDIFGLSILDNLNSIVTGTVVDPDFMIRMLGQMRSFFPPYADG